MIVSIAGGIGVFLLGMALLTDGLKALAGPALRRTLTRFVAGPYSGLAAGATMTALVQSSSATTLTTIGFVSAGLITFHQALGVVLGANLGTTSTGWIVSLLGFKVSLGAVALPIVFVGALARLLGSGRIGAAGFALAGFGLVFHGIGLLQSGMGDLAMRVSPDDLPGTGLGGRLALVGIGIILTMVMQSSSAAIATTLAALDSGAIGFEQAAALVIGQNIGTTVTAALASIGATVHAKRTALAHILFNVLTGAIAWAILPTFVVVVVRLAAHLEGDPGVVELAAFHTAFNVLGIVVFMPLLGRFARLVERLVPERRPRFARWLDRSVARIVPVGLEAARRAALDLLAALVADAARSIRPAHPIGRRATREVRDGIAHVRAFLALVAQQSQSAAEVARHSALAHALDHLDQLASACDRPPSPADLAAPEVTAVAPTLAGTLDASAAWLASPDGPGPVADAETASHSLADQRRRGRAALLRRAAEGRLAALAGSEAIEALRWLDCVGFHVWRALTYLQEKPPEAHEQGPAVADRSIEPPAPGEPAAHDAAP